MRSINFSNIFIDENDIIGVILVKLIKKGGGFLLNDCHLKKRRYKIISNQK